MVETLNQRLFNEAKRYIPGGVNSPVRSFKAVGGYPLFIKYGRGSKIYSEDNKEFIDYCLSFGTLILGHSHHKIKERLKNVVERGMSFGIPTKSETELAKAVSKAIPSIQKLRLTNSGTEAVMGAIRLARAFTGKNKVMKFKGSYHGHADYLLDCPGVPGDFKKHTLVCPYNDINKTQELVEKHKNDIAAIIVEPVACNMGVVLPKEGFLENLREITKNYNIVLIFDEVITGFRLTYGGAQKIFNIRPDLTCLGKIMGQGLPMGAFGGSNRIMKLLAPEGNVYQAGTFSGNPMSVNSGLVVLRILSESSPYKKLEEITQYLCEEIRKISERYGLDLKINYIGSMFSIFFTNKEVRDYNAAKTQDTKFVKRFYQGLLTQGIYFSPSGFEANFISTAHTSEDIEKTVKAVVKTFRNLKEN